MQTLLSATPAFDALLPPKLHKGKWHDKRRRRRRRRRRSRSRSRKR
jgi:hypothetical protein